MVLHDADMLRQEREEPCPNAAPLFAQLCDLPLGISDKHDVGKARQTAASMRNADMRETMLQIAADYESIANTLKALDRSRATMRRLEALQ